MMFVPAARLVAVSFFLSMIALPPPLAAQGPARQVPAHQSPARYVADVADLPLMPGLDEMKESRLVFDKPAGRIVETYASGAMTRYEVLAFYDSTLPQLGWRRDNSGGYLREGERLQLTLREAAGGVTVQFRLFPQ